MEVSAHLCSTCKHKIKIPFYFVGGPMHAKVKLLMLSDTCIARTISAAGVTVLGIIHMKQCTATVYKSLVIY